MYKKIADATVQVICGNSTGTGFFMMNDETVITNYHVIEPHLTDRENIFIKNENDEQLRVSLVDISPVQQYDFAVLRVMERKFLNQTYLEPATSYNHERGSNVIFSGFPHGIHDLLVHQAIISGPLSNHAFYIDGSVNGGNSGGPIIDAASGEVIGIVTQRRFMGGNHLEETLRESRQLQDVLYRGAGSGSVEIMGVNFSQFSLQMAKSIQIFNDVINQNANSGIGIGFKIDYVLESCKRLGLIKN